MLNLQAFQVLADARRLSDGTVRFFLRLLTDYDLTHWRALTVQEAARRYQMKEQTVMLYLSRLLDQGLLEYGRTARIANARRQVRAVQTYRIPAGMLLRDQELQCWLAAIQDQRERETLLSEQSQPKKDKRQGPRSLKERARRCGYVRRKELLAEAAETTGSTKRERKARRTDT